MFSKKMLLTGRELKYIMPLYGRDIFFMKRTYMGMGVEIMDYNIIRLKDIASHSI